MNKSLILSFILGTMFLAQCSESRKNNTADKSTTVTDHANFDEMAKGFLLLEMNCFSCHSPDPTKDLIAPSMASIKNQYMSDGVSQDQLINEFVAFLKNPSAEISKMPDAVKRYNLMPKMGVSDTHVKNIATYIYNTPLEKPNWFKEQYLKEKSKYSGATTIAFSPIEKGKNIAMQTKGVLGKNLLAALNTRGTEDALSFCSTRAITLTDSMSIVLSASIKRVSDKNRNPANAANQDELKYINQTKELISKGENPKPQLIESDGKHIGYYPIMSNQMCMQCHGQKDSDISLNTWTKINQLYPDDKAFGYNPNELRGIWVVEMDK